VNINATFIGQMIAFAVFVLFCMKYVWPPLMAAIEDRQKTIADGLSAADRAGQDLELAKAKATERLKEAKVQAAIIVEQANKRKSQVVDEAKVEAQAEREKILAQGRAEIEAERIKAREELRQQVADLAIAGAEKILARSIDRAANSDIVDQLVKEL